MVHETWNSSTPTLLGLPAELRVKIYQYVLPELEVTEWMTADPAVYAVVEDCLGSEEHMTSRYQVSPALPLGIQTACKQLSQEIRPVVQSCPVRYVLGRACSRHDWRGPPVVLRCQVQSVQIPGNYHRNRSSACGLFNQGMFPNLRRAEIAYDRWHAYEVNIRAVAVVAEVLQFLDLGCNEPTDQALSALKTILKDAAQGQIPPCDLMAFVQAKKLVFQAPFNLWVSPPAGRSIEYYLVAIGVIGFLCELAKPSTDLEQSFTWCPAGIKIESLRDNRSKHQPRTLERLGLRLRAHDEPPAAGNNWFIL